MTNGEVTDPQEIEFRRRWYEAHAQRAEAEPDYKEFSGWLPRYRAGADKALAIRDRLATDGDLERFQTEFRALANQHGGGLFKGPHRAGYVTSMIKNTDDPAELARLLIDGLTVPRDRSSAAQKLCALIEHAIRIKVRGYPFPGVANNFLSFFWSMEQESRWPVVSGVGERFMDFVTGENWSGNWSNYSQLSDDETRENYLRYMDHQSAPVGEDGRNRYPGESYLRYMDRIGQLDDDPYRYQVVARWWRSRRPLFLDPVLVERCAFGRGPDSASVPVQLRRVNAEALVAISGYLGRELIKDVSAVLDYEPELVKLVRDLNTDQPRSDLWVSWRNQEYMLDLRLWINHQGVAIGVTPELQGPDWLAEAADTCKNIEVEGFRMMGTRGSSHGDDVGFAGRAGSFIYGRWYEPEQLADLDLRTEVREVSSAARPVIEALISRARRRKISGDPLGSDIEQFLQETGYPGELDIGNKEVQPAFRQMLLSDNLPTVEPTRLRKIWAGQRLGYGNPGIQSTLSASVKNAADAEYQRILNTFDFLCWGEGDDADRIDAVLDDSSYKVRGLGESVVLKLLAICHPDRYLCVYPYRGIRGKLRMLQVLGLEEPSRGASIGRRHVEANDRLRARLEPLFPDDPWGMMKFLYWYADQKHKPQNGGPDPIEVAAKDLLVDRRFLDDIVELLEDKGQVILYGPPGTGKTYLAQRLAKALAPDSDYRALVQFHPSTSYEDFFEGYRPEPTEDGGISYSLTSGPLARMAEHAENRPGRRHIMVIDEINRANLPRVLGELLFLFEYRDEWVSTLYRADEEFNLPKSIWFIGTMNTADRSIALVDAALRRRFHFVPFFPDRGPTEGLLGRWLEREGQPAWVGELVDMVNRELTKKLGGDLQLGASHFMRKGYLPEPAEDDQRLRRIWEYNIEPFIEDQFFGDPGAINRFRFGKVVARYRSSVGTDQPEDGPDEQGGTT